MLDSETGAQFGPAAPADAPTEPSDPAPVIARLLRQLSDDPRLIHQRHEPARSARYGTSTHELDPRVAAALPHERLWTHQATATDLIRAGESVVIATGTASGKSLCFQLPLLEAVLAGGTALALYPTKALAQDQLLALGRWDVPGVVPAAYDGDCSPEERAWIRANANVLFTNPEMLHNSILSARQQWGSFLRSLRLVIVDELHALRGVFGSNVAHVLRRLRRAVRHHGGEEPVFVFTSATIGDPTGLARDLAGVPVRLVDDDGAPRGARDMVLWNPAAATDHLPLSLNTETAALAARLLRAGLRTLVFCGSRRSTEVVAEQIRRSLRDPSVVRSYRGGYLRDERRRIEAELFGGRLRGIVATNALELGVDIGGLDAVVMSGYPGTVASFRQQLGRCGRSDRASLALLVAGENQLDQWICDHPHELFERAPERATISLDNPHLYVPHLGCAAHEHPLSPADAEFWPTQLDEGVRQLVTSDRARIDGRPSSGDGAGPSVSWIGRGSPARTISLRSAGNGEFRIVRAGDDPTFSPLIGTIPDTSVQAATHVGAIYLHQGVAWRVTAVDEATRTVSVVPDPGDTYTLARTNKTVSLLGSDATTEAAGWTLSLGPVRVATSVTGYQVRSALTHEVLRREPLDVPDSTLDTRAVWYTFAPGFLQAAGIDDGDAAGALHAAEHAAIGLLPLFAICDRWDVGGLSTTWLADSASPAIVIHDAYPGGAGMAEMAYEVASRHLEATLEVLLNCRCPDGCPRCVQSPKCGNGNEPLDKYGAARLLSAMCGRDPAAVVAREFVGF